MEGGGVGTMSAKAPHERRLCQLGQWEGLKGGQRTEREKKLGQGSRICKVLQVFKGSCICPKKDRF